MNKIKKTIQINTLNSIITKAPFVLVVQAPKLTTEEYKATSLELINLGYKTKVVKNKLIRAALKTSMFLNFGTLFSNFNFIIYSDALTPDASLDKLLKVIKLNPKLSLIGGKYQEYLLRASHFRTLVKLGSINTLQINLVALLFNQLKSPMLTLNSVKSLPLKVLNSKQ